MKKAKLNMALITAAIIVGDFTNSFIMIGLLLNPKFHTRNNMHKTPPITKRQIMAAEFHAKSTPPNVIANSTNTIPDVTRKVPM